ncbi:MAG: hypothetical protein Athens101428_325 [Candidatus Berkelbacteria bacterium Athens1014_28]|uniref:Prepilin-type N-terminal cleavage/methylation domain-containing protein n=1 Tax=Candidatus Berkelbacteria bacterium Athens1014_28 TaxID=2017145 RepID=A0A554LNZ0_9BACT|nr:MAG: hypothetical protein Athens101428_325 [Candidatus Berkelbacteria bacterium Athens1014_28]
MLKQVQHDKHVAFRNLRKLIIENLMKIENCKIRKLSAFTLIEVLIAVVIFSFAMIVATGIFSNIIGAESSIVANFLVNKESARLTRQISDDIISANGKGKVEKLGIPAVGYDSIRGVLFLDAGKKIMRPSSLCISAPESASCNFSGIVLFSSNGLKIYYIDPADKSLKYASSGTTTLKVDASEVVVTGEYSFSQISSEKIEITDSKFQGIGCYSSSTDCSNMPFAKADLTFATRDFDTKAPARRAKINLITSVTVRSY